MYKIMTAGPTQVRENVRMARSFETTNPDLDLDFYEFYKETCDIINKTKENKKRVITVGTTSVRVLETVMQKHNELVPCSGFTDIFIYPGYEFKIVDNLITNFHLPKSTLIMLISALAGRERVLNAYNEAIKHNYRFFSFGDSMFIINK